MVLRASSKSRFGRTKIGDYWQYETTLVNFALVVNFEKRRVIGVTVFF